MSLSADNVVVVELGDQNDIPMVSGAKVYEGSAVGLTSGYARALNAGDVFAGHALRGVDNTAGQSGDKSVKVRTGRYRLQVTLDSVAQANVGAAVYMSDDGTYTLTSSGNSRVGTVIRFVGTNTCVIEFEVFSV